MKTETKILIVAIIMILSVGPMSYFFSTAPTQIDLPEQNETPTAYFFSGNLTGTIIEIQPYIYYVGVASFNSESIVSSILDTIEEINNYSIDVALNPNGDGYQYTITVPVDGSAQIKKIGFSLAWKFINVFDQGSSGLPYTLAKIEIPQNFTMQSTTGQVNITSKEGREQNAVLMYSKENGDFAQVNCKQLMTSLDYTLVKTPSICYDTEIFNKQAYLGLSLLDVLFIKPKQAFMTLNATEITGVRFTGEYSFAGMESVSMSGLESETGATISLVPDESNRAKGNFTIIAPYINMTEVARLLVVFRENNFTIDKQYKEATVPLPESMTFENETYVPFAMPYATGIIDINDSPRTYYFNVSATIVYGEIIKIQLKKSGLA